jgi:hypothetical protein
VSIEFCIAKCSEIVKRDLTGAETLIVGIAYNLGFGAGVKHMVKDNETKDQK